MNTNARFSYDLLEEMCGRQGFTKVGNKFVSVISEETKAYIDQYFFVCSNGAYLVWDPVKQVFVEHRKETIDQLYFNRMPSEVKQWFHTGNKKIYTMVCDFDTPRIDRVNNQINTFLGFKHEYKPFNSFDADVQNAVDFFLEFIKDIICSGSQECFEYIMKWLAVIAHKKRNSSLLYLKGIEGIGKSTFSDMLIKWIFGASSCIVSPAYPLTGDFNKTLMGKILVVFEELPVFSEGEWSAVSGKLKRMITTDTEMYNEKNEKIIKTNNLNNYIVNTNVEALKNSEGRRIFIVQVSIDRCKDYKFFGKFEEMCANDKVGQAIYSYLCEVDISGFEAQKCMPETRLKKNAKAERIDNAFKFVKYEFILKNKPVKDTLSSVYNKYCDWCVVEGYKQYTKIKFNEALGSVGIVSTKSNGQMKFSASHEHLMKIADKLEWIHETDEFESDFVPEEKPAKKSEIALVEEIEALKAQNKELLERLKQYEAKQESEVIDEPEDIVEKPNKNQKKVKGKKAEIKDPNVVEFDF